MPSPELMILDVGHGNCAVLRDLDGILVIDCPQGPTLLEALELAGVREVDYVIISHADEDHVAGLLALLTHEQIRVKEVFINPDARKRTRIWQAVRIALDDAYNRTGTRARLGVTTQNTGEIAVGEVLVEILSPTAGEALSGPGGYDTTGKKMDTNSASIVVGLVHKGHRVAVLCGDIDQRSLDGLQERTDGFPTDILVYPHHGGSTGRTNNEAFAASLVGLSRPRIVVFSLGRDRFDNPREDVIRGLRSTVPEAHVICTQLARACAAELPASTPGHLTVLPATGREKNRCCGGSMLIALNGSESTVMPLKVAHLAFVAANAPTARCMRIR